MGRTIVVAAAVLALAAPAAHPAARGFKGTVTVTYTLKPEPIVVEGHPATHDGAGSFHGVYTVSGGRFRAKGFPPNAYLLGGSGTENLDVHRHDTEGVSDLTFTAMASGTVRLIRRPNGPTDTSPLLLILKPHNRFTLGLEAGLDQASNAGLPLTYKLQRVDTQPCLGAQGNKIRTTIYEQGQLTTTTQVCPGEAPIPTQTEGTPQTESIWGANVWASHAQATRASQHALDLRPRQERPDAWHGRHPAQEALLGSGRRHLPVPAVGYRKPPRPERRRER
jgi:hypothetical protein